MVPFGQGQRWSIKPLQYTKHLCDAIRFCCVWSRVLTTSNGVTVIELWKISINWSWFSVNREVVKATHLIARLIVHPNKRIAFVERVLSEIAYRPYRHDIQCLSHLWICKSYSHKITNWLFSIAIKNDLNLIWNRFNNNRKDLKFSLLNWRFFLLTVAIQWNFLFTHHSIETCYHNRLANGWLIENEIVSIANILYFYLIMTVQSLPAHTTCDVMIIIVIAVRRRFDDISYSWSFHAFETHVFVCKALT